jgi:hypothetical protein
VTKVALKKIIFYTVMIAIASIFSYIYYTHMYESNRLSFFIDKNLQKDEEFKA